ncbi:hypothetical protein, partial [Flavobacterium sp.]|uniref:hypothetical protein n=1 Tax=Flavobacterium sp. TaxID=239 RepID=UPI003B9B4E07
RLPAARIAAKNPQSGRCKFGVLLLATKEAKVKALPNAPDAADLLRQFGFQPRVKRIAGNAAQKVKLVKIT